MKYLKVFFGLSLSLFGIAGIFFGLIGIINTIGSKMADDGGPFSAPISTGGSIVITVGYILVLIFGLWLVKAVFRKKKSNSISS
ncbi:MAG: hypothetical protein HY920_00170 [Elusimicrobia bacterium]|nr:hypothetical protein [Elusimicrobiota bacterium]